MQSINCRINNLLTVANNFANIITIERELNTN